MNGQQENVSGERIDQPAVKKPYAAPVLQDFGNIRAITQNVGTRGRFDGSGRGLKTKA